MLTYIKQGVQAIKNQTDYLYKKALDSNDTANSMADYVKDQIYSSNAKYIAEAAISGPTSGSLAHQVNGLLRGTPTCATANGAAAYNSNLVNITDTGYLTGISLHMATKVGTQGTIDITVTIDGVTVINSVDYLHVNGSESLNITIPFMARFSTSLVIAINASDCDKYAYIATYVLD